MFCYFSAVNNRVPSGSTSSLHTAESPASEPCSQAAGTVPSQSALPMYPSVDIDAHVSCCKGFARAWFSLEFYKANKTGSVLAEVH